MQLVRKFPAFLLFAMLATAAAIFLALSGILRSSLEKEIIKRGDAAAQAFAIANAPLVANLDSPEDAARLQHNLLALAKDPDVVDARVADAAGIVTASSAPEGVGKKLPGYLVASDAASYYADPKHQLYHFRSDVRDGHRWLGPFVLSVSSTPLVLALANARLQAFVFALGVAVVVSIFGLLWMRRQLRPLKVMSAALRAIAKGDFSFRMPEERRDEIGDLGAAFNHMLKRADLFFRYIDQGVVERMVADASLSEPGGRLTDLAVVFGDMRGYTALSNRRSANEVVRIVNTYFHLFIECIAQFKGVVDKTMGDAIMAVFERPQDSPVHLYKRRSVLAVTYMKAASRILNRFLAIRVAEGQPLEIEPREFGFSLAAGPAIVGNIGSRRRMDYTVCGRVVNLASRIEALTKHGEVIIDDFTFVGTEQFVSTEPLPPVQPKGFSANEKVTPHRVIGLDEEEAHKLRIFMKRLFAYSFVNNILAPKGLHAGKLQTWCKEAELVLIRLIAEMPVRDFFARADPETTALLADDQAIKMPMAPRKTERDATQRIVRRKRP